MLKGQAKKDYQRNYMKLKRSNIGSDGTGGLTQYHPVMKYLIPGEDRKKMEAIVESLKKHRQAENVYLGYPQLGGIPLDIVGEMLEVTQ